MLARVRLLYEDLQFLQNELLADAAAPTPVADAPLHHRGQIRVEVRRIIVRIRTDITAPLVVEELKRSGFPFTAQRPVCNVGNVLKRFVAEGFLVELESGSGRRPARYELAKAQ